MKTGKTELLAKMYGESNEILEILKRGEAKRNERFERMEKEYETRNQLMMLQAENERKKLDFERTKQEKEFMEKDLNSISDPLERDYFYRKKQEIIEKTSRNSGEAGSTYAFSHGNIGNFSEFGGGYGGGNLPYY